MDKLKKTLELDYKAGLALRYAPPHIEEEIAKSTLIAYPTMDDLNEETREYVEFVAEATKRNGGNKNKANEEIQAYKYEKGLITKPKYSCLKVSKGVNVSVEKLNRYKNTIDPLFRFEEQNEEYEGGNEKLDIFGVFLKCEDNGKDFYTNAPDYLKERMK